MGDAAVDLARDGRDQPKDEKRNEGLHLGR